MTEKKESMIEKAIRIALDAHHGQLDKSGRPYILHPLRVALGMKDEKELLVALLHDVLEDSDYTDDDLLRHGFSAEIVAASVCLAHAEDEEYSDYIKKVKANTLARRVKLADLQDNLNVLRLNAVTEADFERIRKYHRAWIELSEA